MPVPYEQLVEEIVKVPRRALECRCFSRAGSFFGVFCSSCALLTARKCANNDRLLFLGYMRFASLYEGS